MNAPQGEETIFAEALRLPPEERAAYLAQSTDGNAELRQRVEALLGSYQAGDFLEQAAATQLRPTLHITVPLTEKAGDTIGRYKLLQQIGEGGCGVVYMAEQAEPVRRRVALKIIKLGMDTKSVIARFEAERQAVAMMDHPNIAKVFDAGATQTGRPYFVMELVRGMKITDYCDEAKLSTRARLDLFIQVCQAIQHAHQKGIIHRDIKPSNILVSANDGVLVPKVIDFGIAKATTGQQLTDKTLFTAFEQFIGTPAYMSPEQAVITNVDIDTRSDIYALGVLLYEMLTGKTPFDAKELLAIGLDEMRRTIREQEPLRPSTRLSTLPGQELSTTAQRRGLDAPKLVSELRGDLDWIVMKALEKDRARRYETANGLAMDIQRHLSNEPVVACPPSRLYRLQKMVRRNKLAFAAGSAVAVSLVIGLTVSTVLFFRERAARERANEQEANAREQAAISQAVNDFLQNDLLRQASSYSQAEAGFKPDPNLTVREALERAAKRIADRFKDQPLQEAAVRGTIGVALRGLGEPERAIPHLQQSLELGRAGWGPDHTNNWGVMTALARAYDDVRKFDQALPLLEQTLKLMKARLGLDNQRTLSLMNHLAITYQHAGKLDQALPLYEQTLKLMKARLGPDHRQTLIVMNNLATAYGDAGKLDQALPLYEETLKLMEARLGPDDPFTHYAMNNLANAYNATGKHDQALPLYEEALKLKKAALGPDHPDSLSGMNNLAKAYEDAGKLDQALPVWEEALKLTKAKMGPDHPDSLIGMNNLAKAYEGAGKLDQALPVWEEALKLTKAKMGPDHPNTLVSMGHVAESFVRMKNYTEAESWSRNLLSTIKQREGPPSESCANALASLGQRFLKRQQWAGAEPLLRECLAIREKKQPDGWDTFSARSMLGGALLGQGKLAEARPLVVAGYEGLKKVSETKAALDNDRRDDLTDAMDRLEVLYEKCQDQQEAAQWKAEIERVRKVNDPGAIRRWLLLLPIAVASGQSGAKGLEIEQLSNEANLRPRLGDKVSVGGRDLVWREYPLRDYLINFNGVLGEETPRSVVYAVCYVEASTPRKGLVLKVGSDDQARIYLNGQKIYEHPRGRALRLDEDTISDVELRAGLNVLVFKVVNGAANWRGSLRFTDKEDQPVQGLKVTLEPD